MARRGQAEGGVGGASGFVGLRGGLSGVRDAQGSVLPGPGPNGFYDKTSEIFEVGILLGVLLAMVAWLLTKVVGKVRGFLRSVKEERARDAAAWQEGAE